MSRNADQIRREIEQTRGQLAQNLEAIGDRVSPKHVVEQISDKVNPRKILNRQTEKVKEGLSNVGDSVMGRATDAVDGVKGTLSGVAGSAGGVARSAGGIVSGAGDKASSAGDGARQQALSLSERVRSVSTSATGQLRSAPDNNPMATALLAFGAGLVVGLALPPSDKERQAASTVHDQVVEPIKQQAVRAGKAVTGELQPAAQSKVERVKRTATGAAERVKEEAREATAQVQDQAGGAAQQVKGQARRGAKTTQSQARSAATTTKTTAKRSAAQVRERV
jgi:hypothetical protein